MKYPYSRRPFWLGTVIALVLAATLIAFLHRQYSVEQQELTVQLYQQVCERTATLLVERLQHRFGGVIRETIEKTEHEAVSRYELTKVAPQLNAGLVEHPFVERFFVWSYRQPVALRDQVLFYRPIARGSADEIPSAAGAGGTFFVDPKQGRTLIEEAANPRHGHRTFIAEQFVFGGVPYQVMIHQFGTEPPLHRVRGILGYTVNLSTVRRSVAREIFTEELRATIPQTFPRLNFTVLDEWGEVVYGTRPPHDAPAASAALDLSFFAEDLAKVFVDNQLKPPQWHLIVSSESTEQPVAKRQYLFAAVLLLIVIALVCAVTVHRESTRLSEMHSEFVSNVSHQLRTPLALLLATAETLRLQRVRTPDKINEYARRLENQAGRLARLIDQILRFSRIQAGQDLYEFKRLDLVVLVKGVLARFDLPESYNGLSLNYEGPDEEISIQADSAALEEMLVNLVENAVKYSGPRKEVLVTVRQYGNAVVLSIRDNGPGIPMTDIPHIFDRFYRGISSGHAQGFGLGLAIVNDIVRVHGGQVTVHSMLGHGSDFRIRLPLFPEI